jgi:hypothetical protein
MKQQGVSGGGKGKLPPRPLWGETAGAYQIPCQEEEAQGAALLLPAIEAITIPMISAAKLAD